MLTSRIDRSTFRFVEGPSRTWTSSPDFFSSIWSKYSTMAGYAWEGRGSKERGEKGDEGEKGEGELAEGGTAEMGKREETSGESIRRGAAPMLCKVNLEAGHAGMSGRYEGLREEALVLAFAVWAMQRRDEEARAGRNGL